MHLPVWFALATITLLSWGIVGLLQKLSTNHLSSESALVWFVAGLLVLQPLLLPGRALLDYPPLSLFWGLLSGALSALGAWALLAALRSGGRASIVSPLTALYPLAVVLVAPFCLHESISPLRGLGVLSALLAVFLLSMDAQKS